MYCNLLINQLPQHTDSGIRIRTDFRESIKFELLMQDRAIKDDKKIRMILNLYYYRPEQITDIKKALEEVVWFYSGGDKKKIQIEQQRTIIKSKFIAMNLMQNIYIVLLCSNIKLI